MAALGMSILSPVDLLPGGEIVDDGIEDSWSAKSWAMVALVTLVDTCTLLLPALLRTTIEPVPLWV
jgi:hypothetical protein